MKQHPVPQHIASYQFHLIGQMTLKQFLEVAAGIILAWLTYTLHISALIKWPFVVIFGFSGIALAFLPVEERPLDVWIINFFRSCYSPTQFFWRKKTVIPEILQPYRARTHKIKVNLPKKETLKMIEYLESITTSEAENKIEQKRLNHLKRISALLGYTADLNQINLPQNIPPIESVSANVKVRRLGPQNINIVPQPVLESKEPTIPIIEAAPPLTPPILVESSFAQKLDPAVAAQFSTTLPIPSIPDIPNIVVGMVLNDLDKIIQNALIEIVDSQNETVRALKTNKLGQFFCASPLKNGTYKIKIEHPDWSFDIMEFKTEGKIIPPLKIKALKKINN